jgi:uncharacterized protein (TIGR03435 family)
MAAHGQAPTPAPSAQVATPTYDVVSIKQNKSGDGGMSINNRNGNYQATNIELLNLIENAYGIREDLISGLPGWANSVCFDVYAKIVNPDMEAINKLTPEQHQGMLLAIMKDRFHLQAHLETKTLPVYDLVAAKGGFKFTGAASPDTAAAMARSGLAGAGSMMMSNSELTAHGVQLSTLINSLSAKLQRTIIDKTGLTGTYDFELKWTPEGEASADNGQADSQSSTSSLFTALQEQLGLKLQSSKGPVETLVVDHIEMPSEN